MSGVTLLCVVTIRVADIALCCSVGQYCGGKAKQMTVKRALVSTGRGYIIIMLIFFSS